MSTSSDHGWCHHNWDECRLGYMHRYHETSCYECERLMKQERDTWLCTTYYSIWHGVKGYLSHKGFRGAFRKGWDARAADQDYDTCPYNKGWVRADRRGRYNRGFGPAYENAWQVGWAWADHYALILGYIDDAETTLTLARLGGFLPDCWDEKKKDVKQYTLAGERT